jgi:hypothetical protein
MDKPRSSAPIIAAVLLLLPVLYAGSYLALVTPGRQQFVDFGPPIGEVPSPADYRVAANSCHRLFWPLEQIDRRVRPGVWEPSDNLIFDGNLILNVK